MRVSKSSIMLLALLLFIEGNISAQLFCPYPDYELDSTYYFYVLNEQDTVPGRILLKQSNDGSFVQYKTEIFKGERAQKLKHPEPVPYENWEYCHNTTRLFHGSFEDGRETGVWSFGRRHGTNYGMRSISNHYFWIEFGKETITYSTNHWRSIEVKFINDSSRVTGSIDYFYDTPDEGIQVLIDCKRGSGCAYFVEGYEKPFLKGPFDELESSIGEILFGGYDRQIKAIINAKRL